MSKIPTREQLQKERDRRYRERQELAETFDKAADILQMNDSYNFRPVIVHLRNEAAKWRQ